MIEAALALLGPWRSPALAFAVALGAALLVRPVPAMAGVAAALGLLAGLFDVFGVMIVTPRMLPERLPWLVLAAALVGLWLQRVQLGSRGKAVLLVGLVLPASWWMLGAPRNLPDLMRVAPLAPPVAAAFVLALTQWRRERGTQPGWRSAAAGAALVAGFSLAGAPALFSGLAACAVAAACGATLGVADREGARIGDAGTLPLAAGIAGTAVAAGLAWPNAMVIAAAALGVLVLALPLPDTGKEKRV
jgi:hypothetical protein